MNSSISNDFLFYVSFLKVFFFKCGPFLVFNKFVTILILFCVLVFLVLGFFAFFAIWFFGQEACEILAPPPGIKPAPQHRKVKSSPLDLQGSSSSDFLLFLFEVPVKKFLILRIL